MEHAFTALGHPGAQRLTAAQIQAAIVAEAAPDVARTFLSKTLAPMLQAAGGISGNAVGVATNLFRRHPQLKASLVAAQSLEQARAEGLEQGRQQAEEENAQARAELEQIKNQYREEYEKQVDELEPAFVEIVIKYVQKLTGIYADDKKEIILHLIDNALKDKHGNENFIVRVSEADFPVVSYSKDAIRGYLSEGAQLEVVADKLLERNQCMIETESRIYDCSLDGQLMSLIEDIRLLAEKE